MIKWTSLYLGWLCARQRNPSNAGPPDIGQISVSQTKRPSRSFPPVTHRDVIQSSRSENHAEREVCVSFRRETALRNHSDVSKCPHIDFPLNQWLFASISEKCITSFNNTKLRSSVWLRKNQCTNVQRAAKFWWMWIVLLFLAHVNCVALRYRGICRKCCPKTRNDFTSNSNNIIIVGRKLVVFEFLYGIFP